MAQDKTKKKTDKSRLVESQEDKPVRYVSSDVSFQEQRDFYIGKILEDRYEIEAFIGEGGVGAVYKAKHLLMNKTVAVKFLVPSLVKDQRAFKRFKTEAEITCNLSHQNIVTVREYGISDGNPFLVMDFIEGQTLRDFMSSGQKPAENRIIDWILQVTEALEYAHSVKVIHRDIKPGNIVIEDGGPTETVKILDFGIAKLVESENLETTGATRTGELFGTPTYMSPEQCRGGEIDTRSDIYSIGCVLYELASGKPPFEAQSALEIFVHHTSEPVPPIESQNISKSFKQVIYKCLMKNPDDRYQDVEELKRDLKRIRAGEKVSIKLAKDRQPPKSDIRLKIALAASLLCCATFAVLYFSNGFSSLEEKVLPEWEVLVKKADKAIEQKDREQAIVHLNRALAVARKSNSKAQVRLDILYRLAVNYKLNFDYKSFKRVAREYVKLAFQVGEDAKAENLLANIAMYEFENSEYDDALKDLRLLERSALASRKDDYSMFIRVYELMGRIYFACGDMENAETYLLKCIKIRNRIHMAGYDGCSGFAHWTLAKMYKARNELDKAYKHLKLSKDSKQAILSLTRATTGPEREFLALPIEEEFDSLAQTLNR